MSQRALHFIDIPERSMKPRTAGLTLARDYGFGYHQAEDWMESVGDFIDFIKTRHLFTMLASMDEGDLTRRKIRLYRSHNIEVNPGGIVFEMAVLSNSVAQTFETLAAMGFSATEISENIIDIELVEKLRYTKMAKAAGLKVLFEIGDKYPQSQLDVDYAEKEIKELQDVGCDLIILERAVIEMCLGQKGERPEAALLTELVSRVGLGPIVFEAEAVPHQVWLFHEFGPDVNIGPNLEPEYIAKLEATRRTLSREGGYTWMVDKIQSAGTVA